MVSHTVHSFVWLLLLIILSVRFIHIFVCIRDSVFFIAVGKGIVN